ncbi:hypothetical protein AVEN_151914-1 [Araneus ventricosus]|uniref:DUF4219 domain-containing protein n=1 Tax=Araneus ventricosus TaxID=182803 RepID=A0A4Y2JHS9_ARAVE|nr:hypothetical protein AVEN_151914-1 [Araneus ventricosus]
MESSIEQLEADNYSSWRIDMKVLLMERNYWRIETGTEIKPEEEKFKELKHFNSVKDKAYRTIYFNISKTYRYVIANREDPVAAWKHLEHFRPDSRDRVIGLTDVFSSCRINPQEETRIYAARIRRIVYQLKDAAKQINGLSQAFQLIRFLRRNSMVLSNISTGGTTRSQWRFFAQVLEVLASCLEYLEGLKNYSTYIVMLSQRRICALG